MLHSVEYNMYSIYYLFIYIFINIYICVHIDDAYYFRCSVYKTPWNGVIVIIDMCNNLALFDLITIYCS